MMVEDDENILGRKGEPMPQTLSHWKHLHELAGNTMAKQDDEIARLKQRINTLEQKLEQRNG